MTINNFKNAISIQIDRMINLSSELFYVEVDRDELFELYLESFPEGTNPIFIKRTVHDCSCCKGFIRNIGHLVAIINGRIETIWDVQVDDFFQTVADALSQKVKSKDIAGVYRYVQNTLGGKTNTEKVVKGGLYVENIYEHLHYMLPPKFVNTTDIATVRGNYRTNKEVLERSLTEISLEASETVIELIEQNSLYRGEEFLHIVKKFQSVKNEFDLQLPKNRDIFLWIMSADLKEAGRFKNTVIGTLLHDLSIGTELEEAVKKFETKVAPTNYKRPTALITQSMINRAEEEIIELGIEKSLARRFATAKDLTVNNVMFVDKPTKKKMKKEKKKKSILAELEPTKIAIDPDKIQKINIDEFVATILPHAENIEVMVENKQVNNLMSVIAPKNRKSPNIMKWENPFSWSYNGEVTDSIRERVKKAGGNVEGFMRFSLSWDYYDDLDIHIIEPTGNEIFYANKRSSYSGGFLDIDMNVQPNTLEPVENIAWADRGGILDGKYKVFVENFTKRDMSASGFEIEMEIDGQTSRFVYDKPLRNKEQVLVIEFEYRYEQGLKTVESLSPSTTSKEIWGINTQKWTKVEMILNSPNHWNGQQTGNRHFFFILNKCLNPDKARGFYNEFLRNELNEHRKVFELLSSKMKTEPSDKQLSGVGFSSTQENSLLCRVTGKFDRTMMITFAPPRLTVKPDIIDSRVFSVVGLCEICKRDVTNIDSRLPCPRCVRIFHTSHFLEYHRVSGVCAVCKESVTQHQIDEIVQLATV